MSLEEIIESIKTERKRQNILWGDEFDSLNTVNDWCAFITRYNGLAVYAETSEEWKKAMLKVAALAVAALEAFEINGQLPPRHYD